MISVMNQRFYVLFFLRTILIFSYREELKNLDRNYWTRIGPTSEWFNRNKLSLNLSKTKFMLFTNQKCFDNVCLILNGITIERVSEFRFLGVLIDEKFKWKSHIAYVRNKMCKNIAVLSKVKFMLNYKAMRSLYCSFILPYLMYCLEVWGNSYFTNLMLYLFCKKEQ